MNDITQIQPLVSRSKLDLGALFVAPTTDVQTIICDAFIQALGITPVGLDDNFFELGGDSINAEILALLIGEALGRPFPISGRLDFGTPRLVEQAFANNENSPTISDEVPFFLVHGKVGYSVLKPAFRSCLNASNPHKRKVSEHFSI